MAPEEHQRWRQRAIAVRDGAVARGADADEEILDYQTLHVDAWIAAVRRRKDLRRASLPDHERDAYWRTEPGRLSTSEWSRCRTSGTST